MNRLASLFYKAARVVGMCRIGAEEGDSQFKRIGNLKHPSLINEQPAPTEDTLRADKILESAGPMPEGFSKKTKEEWVADIVRTIAKAGIGCDVVVEQHGLSFVVNPEDAKQFEELMREEANLKTSWVV